MIILIIFLIYYFVVASAGICAGYVMDLKKHSLEKYFQKQKESIKKRGKIITFLNRNYKAYYKNNDKYVYTKCINYAKKWELEDINYAITYLKADIKIFDAIGLLITVCVGLGSVIINSYVQYFVKFLGEKFENNIGNLFGIIYIFLMVILIRSITPLMRKQIFLLNILEDAKEYIIDREKKEYSA